MATTLPSPPLSREVSIEPVTNDKPTAVSAVRSDPNSLTERLDQLLEQYLTLLDEYTTLRESLSKHFSSGFFSLAQAQRTSNLGAGRRYGEMYYDERMRAHRRLRLITSEEKQESIQDNTTKIVVAKVVPNQTLVAGNDETGTGDVFTAPKSDDTSSTTDTAKKAEARKQDPADRDPVTWFGVLVPPALRQTQSHFVAAVENTIPQLLSKDREMRVLEAKVWVVRAQLGMLEDYHYEPDGLLGQVEKMRVKE